MDIFLDDKPIETAFLAEEATIEESLHQVQTALCSSAQVVVGFRCDGTDVPANEMAETLLKPVRSFERLEVFTGTTGSLVTDAMEQAARCLCDSETACQEVANLLTQGLTSEATTMLGECLRTWQQIHEALGKSIEMLGLDPETAQAGGETLVALIQQPMGTLLQVKEALQAQDYVLLADVLQYEFQEVAQVWHNIIGHLREEAEERT